jgi:hypothetical protein
MNILKMFNFKKNNKTIRDIAVKSLCKIISEYSTWYDEHGLCLPPDYASDPSAWTEALHKVKRAFILLNDELHQRGELWEAKNKWKKFGEQDSEKIDELNKEIKEGMMIFGAQLLYLTDYKNSIS